MCVEGGGGGGGGGGCNALGIFTRHIGLGLGMSARDLQLTGCTQMLPRHHIPSCEESGHRTHFPDYPLHGTTKHGRTGGLS